MTYPVEKVLLGLCETISVLHCIVINLLAFYVNAGFILIKYTMGCAGITERILTNSNLAWLILSKKCLLY